MILIKHVRHNVRNTNYDLLVYQIKETGEYTIFIEKGGSRVSWSINASQEIVQDAKGSPRIDEILIICAINNINRNDFGFF